MSVRGDKAYELFLSGYNCTQAVVGAFADVIGMDFGFRLGCIWVWRRHGNPGGMRTFSGAVIVVNALYGYSDPKMSRQRRRLYSRIQELAAQFRRDNGNVSARSCSGFPDRKARQYRKQERTSITRSVLVRSFADIQRTCLRSTSGNTLR
ncbi:MAG: C-GCAxxG-C-C family (seleno)protein [Oscillospiraceae bacterium]